VPSGKSGREISESKSDMAKCLQGQQPASSHGCSRGACDL
jgi:hypothetical protein